jgi:eukaryotic-like serine/threonine-protein kinase
MSTTTFHYGIPTQAIDAQESSHCPNELISRYDSVLSDQRMSWTEHLHLTRRLGAGGQGVVYLSERRGTDNFTLPVALKIFSPARYEDARSYDEAMARIAEIAVRVAQIQQDNLLDVNNFVDRSRIRIMEMEWIDGYDLNRLLTHEMLERTRERVSNRRWDYLNNVIVTSGPMQPRLKPGVAIAVVRECLAGLAALHREGIVHGDMKPSNIMLKRTGNAKIIDIGSAFELTSPPPQRTCTPMYAAPEVLEGADCSPRSDLASLGYVLIELLAGRPAFVGLAEYRDLLEAKRSLSQRLPQILPQEVVCNELLMSFCRGLISPDPMRRFPSAEAAELAKEGAASFQRQLIKGDLASEYENEIRVWLEELD